MVTAQKADRFLSPPWRLPSSHGAELAFHDEERGHGLGISADFGEGEDRRDEVDHRPWYLRPSPWWYVEYLNQNFNHNSI